MEAYAEIHGRAPSSGLLTQLLGKFRSPEPRRYCLKLSAAEGLSETSVVTCLLPCLKGTARVTISPSFESHRQNCTSIWPLDQPEVDNLPMPQISHFQLNLSEAVHPLGIKSEHGLSYHSSNMVCLWKGLALGVFPIFLMNAKEITKDQVVIV